MSASEKLEALKRADYLTAVSEVAVVFPQIVAVVREAENYYEAWDTGDDVELGDLVAALAALDEALS